MHVLRTAPLPPLQEPLVTPVCVSTQPTDEAAIAFNYPTELNRE